MLHKVYALNLNNENHHALAKLVSTNASVEIVSLNSFDDILLLAENFSAKFLVLDASTTPESINMQRERISGKLLGVHLLWIVQGPDDQKRIELQNTSEHFAKQCFLPNNLSVIQKAAAFYDYLSGASELPLHNENTYVPLKLIYFEKITKAPCDIFLKISDKKYVKIINRNDDLHILEIVEKYITKNIKEFYVPLKNLQDFKEIFHQEIFFKDKNESVTTHHLRVSEAVLSIASDFGLSEYAIDGINKTFAEIDKEFSSNSKLTELLQKIQQNQRSILSNHSYLTAVFITMIGQKTQWFNREIKKNLYMAAILHDIELHGSEHESYEFKSLSEINTLPVKERDAFKNHPMTLASKLSKIDAIPSDVINLISKHHEGAGLESYPMSLHSPQLSPPNCLFNVAHQLSIEVSIIAFNIEKIAIAIDKVRAHYGSNSMKPFIDSFESQVTQKKVS